MAELKKEKLSDDTLETLRDLHREAAENPTTTHMPVQNAEQVADALDELIDFRKEIKPLSFDGAAYAALLDEMRKNIHQLFAVPPELLRGRAPGALALKPGRIDFIPKEDMLAKHTKLTERTARLKRKGQEAVAPYVLGKSLEQERAEFEEALSVGIDPDTEVKETVVDGEIGEMSGLRLMREKSVQAVVEEKEVAFLNAATKWGVERGTAEYEQFYRDTKWLVTTQAFGTRYDLWHEPTSAVLARVWNRRRNHEPVADRHIEFAQDGKAIAEKGDT